MRKVLKEKLKRAIQLMDEAETLISEVKNEYYEGRERNDEYYGLEDVEVNLSDVISDLKSFL